jgi:hypothetical protein
MRYRGRLFVASLLLTVGPALQSCGADTKGQGNAVPEDEAPERYSVDLCKLYYECGCEEFLAPWPFSSEEQCQNALEADAIGALDEGNAADLTYDGQCVADALALYDDLGCDALSDLPFDEILEVIYRVDCKLFYGGDEPGDACESLVESNGDSCVKEARCVDGTCEAAETAPGIGEECQDNEVCRDGAFCLDIDEDGTSVCEDLPGGGETCLGTGDWCDLGHACDQESKECAPAPAEGESCAPGPLWPCAEGLTCSADVCEPLPGGGEACAPQWPQCAPGLTCSGGRCQTDPPVVCYGGL